MTINQRISTYFVSIFVLFALIIILFTVRYEKNIASDKLVAQMELYATMLEQGILPDQLPDTSLRISQIDLTGKVLFDNRLSIDSTDNHLTRKEIREAQHYGYGTALRYSSYNNQLYFYYAKKEKKSFLRIAKPFENRSEALPISYMPIFITLLLFGIASIGYYSTSLRFKSTIKTLKQLIERVDSGDKYNFPDNEFSEISEYIIRSYQKLERTQKALDMEREKLWAHLRLSKRGLCIFSPQRKEILSNELFIQYANFISDRPIQYSEKIFDIPELFDIVEFFDDKQRDYKNVLETKTMEVHKNDRILVVHGIVFPDKSCEITIDDITEREEQALLKRQLTQNISHELKTPVSSIQGFMETIINNPGMDPDKREFFIERCHAQAIRLSYLLQDISMLNKLDEGSGIFDRDDINLNDVIQNVLKDVSLELEEKNITTEVNLPCNATIKGNMSLLYSIFRNLVDNTLHYAGSDISIQINCFRVDNEFLHFSYADTGIGVDSKHLNHLFERFYRVDKGRSRKLGGTGLGLAIVKNAILFHQGRISAKQHPGGGLEFVFSLRKEPLPVID
ncbi:MAG: two-component sensor histidine kinase [Paludibacteraceae bacterium]|nr:two-component sensor histidine kinase [Paludibacteraceae bacterium]